MHSFRTFMMVAQNIQGQFELSSNERMLSYLPLAHGLERAVLEGTSLYVGCHMFFAGNLDTFIEDLNRASPTVFVSVPRLWTKFQHGINDKIPPRIQKAIFHVPAINKMFRKFILKKLGLADVHLALTGYVGFPQLGVECRIADEGEVQVKSPGNMLGYYKAPEQTAATMTDDGFVKTGDVGVMDADGCLKLTGRLKDIFKTAKGKYIALVMLDEETQRSLQKGHHRTEVQESLEALLVQVNQTLEPHEKLGFIVVISEPWTMANDLLAPTMKIRRQKIEDQYVDKFEPWAAQKRSVIWA